MTDYRSIFMNKFYKDIDQKCNERKLQYLAPMPLEHYYEQEKNTTFSKKNDQKRNYFTVFKYSLSLRAE